MYLYFLSATTTYLLVTSPLKAAGVPPSALEGISDDHTDKQREQLENIVTVLKVFISLRRSFTIPRPEREHAWEIHDRALFASVS